MSLHEIVVQGARENNLKGIDLRLPRGAFVTITGVSGSGKSSLVFDTIFQEGQRRFVESLSAYARQFLGGMEKPRVDRIDGLSPTISIDQKAVNRNPRSTVGTITEIHDHIRLLFARLGTAHCSGCRKPLSAQSKDQITDRILASGDGKKVFLLAPVIRERKGEYRKELESLRLQGFVRARIDGEIQRLDEPITLSRYKKHTIDIVLDRLTATKARRSRIAEAVEMALKMAEGVAAVLIDDEYTTFSARLACPDCGVDFPEMEPRLFSFNSPFGACPDCSGLGVQRKIDPGLVIPDPDKTINEGAIATTTRTGYVAYLRLGRGSMEKVARTFGFSLDVPWKKLAKKHRDILLYGSGRRKIRLRWEYEDESGRLIRGEDYKPLKGLIPKMENFYRVTRSPHVERYMSSAVCESCGGARLRPESRMVTFRDEDVCSLSEMTIEVLHQWFKGLRLETRESRIGREVVNEIRSRLQFLIDVGLGYLPLNRGARSLSGGEGQRVRLATQLGSQLQGVLYVLDEPSIGLHQRDNRKLIETIKQLRDRGNTVLVVEHDRDTMLEADCLVDVGPGAGREGGEVVAAGTPRQVIASKSSITAAYLRGDRQIQVPEKIRASDGKTLVVRGATQHNLKSIDVEFPLGCFIAVTGVSGSGKSTLVDLVLQRALARKLHRARDVVGQHASIEGVDEVDKVVEINQSPIGRTPRSNPATYSGAFTHVRDLFALLPESKARGYKKGRFSFNVVGGRCDECGGAGVELIEMQFLADMEIPCDECGGQRYNRETLEILYRGQNIREILDFTIDEAFDFFSKHPKLNRILGTLKRVGLGYLKLGQTATTLSGGEAQRLKLASELARPGTGRTLYILDEPTTGLHFVDIEKLLHALQSLVDAGNTVVIIEHNMDVIKVADWIIDLGPEGGAKGGEVVFAGTPAHTMKCRRSRTGRALADYLKPIDVKSLPKPSAAVREGDGDGQSLRVRGASVHNLQSVNLDVPHGSLSVITGVSGSGKTSLAFDTIFAEAQRRFVESMSTYARRFLSRLDRAPVERIEGLSPAIAIDRRAASRNPRSTVSTSTEIQDYLRMLYARVGTPHCPDCSEIMRSTAPTEAAKKIVSTLGDHRIRILAPLYRRDFSRETPLDRPSGLRSMVSDLKREGYARVLIDGTEHRLDEQLPSNLSRARSVSLVVDRIKVRAGSRGRVVDAIGLALTAGRGVAAVLPEGEDERLFTRKPECPYHGYCLDDEPEPRMFSFNSHVGACDECDGLGRVERIDPDRLLVDSEFPLLDGALAPPWDRELENPRYGVADVLKAIEDHFEVDLDIAFCELPQRVQDAVLFGLDESLTVESVRETRSSKREYTHELEWEGLCVYFENKFRDAEPGGWWRRRLGSLVTEGECDECEGSRLRPQSSAFEVGGKTLGDVAGMTVQVARRFFASVKLRGSRGIVAKEILVEVVNRLDVLEEIGLGYLELGRRSSTLSGGEAQRIRLASQLGNRLVGVLYVLDEPTIGLHSRDTQRLIQTLKGLRDLGNTILVVEHDLDVIRAADHVVDMGPGAGHRGGKVIAEGTLAHVEESASSLTAQYLRGDRSVALPHSHRPLDGEAIKLRKGKLHNLRSVDVDIPLQTITAVTGVSGSGKSTLVLDLLEPAIRDHLAGRRMRGPFKKISVPSELTSLSVVDQSPLGSSPSSNPATYTGVFDSIREVFAQTPEAKMKGFTKKRFSFNQTGGRCEACEGRGIVQIEMHFLSDVFVPCESCDGERFDRDTLSVTYGGRSISDVLNMEISEALEFFSNHRKIRVTLQLLQDIGLGYLRLGQPATTLSGGEAQRVKLAAELGSRRRGHTLFLLDEPTTGLHLEDVSRLVDVFNRLVDAGNTVIVIEHHPDVIKVADRVIDLGPEGGDRGGKVVACGTPEEIASEESSWTGRALARVFGGAITSAQMEQIA